METLKSFLTYHAAEGGLLDANSAFDLARDAGFDTSGIDFSEVAEAANEQAIADTLEGKVLGARLFKTEDGFVFAEMACGTITDGDMSWKNEQEFKAAADGFVGYEITRIT